MPVQVQNSEGWPPRSDLDVDDASEANASGLYDTPGQRWYSCARCGFLYPMRETRIEPITNRRVCVAHCYDAPDPRDPRLMGLQHLQFFPEEVTTDGAF
jgi:hypothetical protein